MDELLQLVNTYLVDPVLAVDSEQLSAERFGSCPWSVDYSFKRQFLVLWAFLYTSSMLVYVIMASITFLEFFVKNRHHFLDQKRRELGCTKKLSFNTAFWPWDNNQIACEIWTSTWSLFLMSGLTATVDMYILCGGGKTYENISDYGWFYFIISPILFLMFTDTLIYWIHRILHWPSVYWLHKLHHKYKETTPWSAFSFHPLDGFAQSVPYHLYVLFFPMHSRLYAATLMMVGLWTVNIHDRMSLHIPGVNGAAHHTIHHTKFNYNYGQYFTFWDKFFNTHKDPYVMWPYTAQILKDGESLPNDPKDE